MFSTSCLRKNTPAESQEEESSGDEAEENPKKSRSKQEESDLERVEKILAVRTNEDGMEQFFVKFKGVAKPHPNAECFPCPCTERNSLSCLHTCLCLLNGDALCATRLCVDWLLPSGHHLGV